MKSLRFKKSLKRQGDVEVIRSRKINPFFKDNFDLHYYSFGSKRLSIEDMVQMGSWCKNNCTGWVRFQRGQAIFESKDDLLMFVLAWG